MLAAVAAIPVDDEAVGVAGLRLPGGVLRADLVAVTGGTGERHEIALLDRPAVAVVAPLEAHASAHIDDLGGRGRPRQRHLVQGAVGLDTGRRAIGRAACRERVCQYV